MDTSTFGATISLVNGAIDAAKKAVGMAKELNNLELKQQVGEVFDAVLDLKVRALELQDENSELRKKLENRESLRFNATSGYFYKEGDPNPICGKCFQGKEHLVVYVKYSAESQFTSANHRCPVCSDINYDR